MAKHQPEAELSAGQDGDPASDDIRGQVFDIQRFCLHDGPGVRTTVFVKGCPLACLWCHNPEGQSRRPQLLYMSDRCILCGECVRACPNHAHQIVDGVHTLDRAACQVSGACVESCCSEALVLVGRSMSVAEVLSTLLRDRSYYERSGGGLTVSGGEPLLELAFVEALLRSAKAAGLHTCIETCAYLDFDRLARVMPYVDLFLCDYKETDPQRHREYTGVSNERILTNLRRLHAAGARLRLRCPIIPGLNDRPDHFAGIAALVHELAGVEGVELMPYHRMGDSKLAGLGMPDPLANDVPSPSEEMLAGWAAQLAELGVTVLNERR